jgi:molybdate transport system substrate-binding protein
MTQPAPDTQALPFNATGLALRGISSMATRQVLADLIPVFQNRAHSAVEMESMGGLDVARRITAGEPFDLVILASDAIDKLIASGHVLASSRTDLVHSGVAVAVRSDAHQPDISSADAVRRAILAARSISYSTGPSGVALAKLFAAWGIAEQLKDRIVQAPVGVPVGTLVARGEVELGFQQLSELIDVPGIAVLGPLPAEIQITTTFSAGVCAASTQPAAVRALLEFLASPEADASKRRQGMEPA